MPDRTSEDVTRLLERKRAWHRAQAKAPLQEKVRILLELQRQVGFSEEVEHRFRAKLNTGFGRS